MTEAGTVSVLGNAGVDLSLALARLARPGETAVASAGGGLLVVVLTVAASLAVPSFVRYRVTRAPVG